MPTVPGKDTLISFRRRKPLIIKTAAFRFERLAQVLKASDFIKTIR